MTDDRDPQIQARFRRAELPPAPDRLRARVAAVTEAQKRPTGGMAALGRHGRFLLPLAAVLVIAAIALTGAGSQRPPIASGSPTPPPPPAGPPHAELQLHAREQEWPLCGPGSCVFQVELQGVGRTWTGQLRFANLGSLKLVDPPLPPLLSDGDYSLRIDLGVFGDAIYPGESGPRYLGVIRSCTAEFRITPETALAVVTISFWDEICTAGAVVTADPETLPTLEVLPTFDAGCGAEGGGCDYNLLLTGPGGSWRAVIQTVKPRDQIPTNELISALPPGTYRLDAESRLRGEEPELGAGFQKDLGVLASCSTEFVVTADTANVNGQVTWTGDQCAITMRSDVRVDDALIPLRFIPIRGTRCGSLGGCAYYVELLSPTGTSRADVEYDADLRPMLGPGLPEAVAPGDYTVQAWILYMSDDISNDGRESFGSEFCSAKLAPTALDPGLTVFGPNTGLVVTIAFNGGGCSINVAVDLVRPVPTAP